MDHQTQITKGFKVLIRHGYYLPAKLILNAYPNIVCTDLLSSTVSIFCTALNGHSKHKEKISECYYETIKLLLSELHFESKIIIDSAEYILQHWIPRSHDFYMKTFDLLCDAGLDISHERIITNIIVTGNITLLYKLYDKCIPLDPDTNYYYKLRFPCCMGGIYIIRDMTEMIDYLVSRIGISPQNIEVLFDNVHDATKYMLGVSIIDGIHSTLTKLFDYITLYNFTITLTAERLQFLIDIIINDNPILLEQYLSVCQYPNNISCSYSQSQLRTIDVLIRYNIVS